jgi:uncharacterized membrane protein YraQ (UPF0718 family)
MSEKQPKAKRKGGGKGGWLFLALVLLLYAISGAVDGELTRQALGKFTQLAEQVVPVLVLVFALIFTTELLLSPARIEKYLGRRSGLRGWLLSLVAGILSTGPIYAWYPVLAELRRQGMSTSLVAAFLYCRAIKLPLLPFMIHYFGITYTVLLMLYLLCFAVVSGLVMQWLLGKDALTD